MSKNSDIMQFCEINICQVMILCLHLHVFILFVTSIRSHKLKIKAEKISSIIASARKFLLSNVLSEINFISSTEESENKGAECIFYNRKFSEDEQGEILIIVGRKIVRALAMILAIFL